MAKKKKEEIKTKFSPEEVKHLEFIQGVINRMGSNSFQMKGWMITIVSALLALYSGSSNKSFLLFAILPTLLFWYLDSYYLQQERKFRGLYNDVAKVPENPKEIKPLCHASQPVHGRKIFPVGCVHFGNRPSALCFCNCGSAGG